MVGEEFFGNLTFLWALSEYQSSPDNHPNMSEVVAELEDLTVEEQLLFTNTIHVKPYMDPDKQD